MLKRRIVFHPSSVLVKWPGRFFYSTEEAVMATSNEVKGIQEGSVDGTKRPRAGIFENGAGI